MGLASLTWCADPQNNLNTIYDGPALHTRGQARKRKLTVTFPPAKEAVQPELAALNKKLAEYERAQRQAEARIIKLTEDKNWLEGEAAWSKASAKFYRAKTEVLEKDLDTSKEDLELQVRLTASTEDRLREEQDNHRDTEQYRAEACSELQVTKERIDIVQRNAIGIVEELRRVIRSIENFDLPAVIDPAVDQDYDSIRSCARRDIYYISRALSRIARFV